MLLAGDYGDYAARGVFSYLIDYGAAVGLGLLHIGNDKYYISILIYKFVICFPEPYFRARLMPIKI